VHSIVLAHDWGRLVRKGIEHAHGERFVGHRLDFFGRGLLEA
jgi:hypothetical protein